ncbi:MAG: hypothetical protein E7678_06140, partial [Ruminococcaceae bacterium]|nr:hypothetical protein [Oscillospiraceae bacterium]
MKKKNGNLKIIIFYIALFLAIVLALTFMFNKNNGEVPPKYGDIIEYFQKDIVKDFTVTSDDVITLTIYEDYTIVPPLTEGETEAPTVEGETTENETEETRAPGTYINDPTKVKTVEYTLQSLDLFVNDCSQYYLSNSNLENYDIEPPKVLPWWVSFLPYLIVIIII